MCPCPHCDTRIALQWHIPEIKGRSDNDGGNLNSAGLTKSRQIDDLIFESREIDGKPLPNTETKTP